MILAAELEQLLTAHASGVWDPKTLAALDGREEFPADAIAVLDGAGLPDAYVLGPDSDFPGLLQLARTVARRDLTVAIAHGKTFLGSASVWVAGTPEQTEALSERVRAGDAVCWGLTERGHGSDLLAGELTAVADPDGWRLDGEKWLINNGTRARFGCVLARTDPAGGGRGFSVFLIDRHTLSDHTWRPLPKTRTHGIRGADISGFTLDGAQVPADALIGEAGDGVNIVLRAMQLTRIACAGLSLGAADHALRLVREAIERRAGRSRWPGEHTYARHVLGRAAAAALTAEAASLLASRSAHTQTGELSVTAAITKAFVPTTVQDMLGRLAELLSPEDIVTSPLGDGFARLERDHRICPIFDGSTVVNRTSLLAQMPRLGRLLRRRTGDTDGLLAAAGPGAPQHPLDPARLTLRSPTGCSAVQSLPAIVEQVREQGMPELTVLADQTLDDLNALAADLVDFVPVSGGLPSTAFHLAERYERSYAAAASLLLWLHDPAASCGPLAQDALWPRACLAQLLDRPEDPAYDQLAGFVLDRDPAEFTLWESVA